MKEQDDKLVLCPKCNSKLKYENYSAHMQKIHNSVIDESNEDSIQFIKKEKNKQSKPKSKGLIGVIIIIFLVIIAASYFLFFASNNELNNDNNGNSTNNGSNTSGPSWLNDYIPAFSIGTGTNNFWINFPVGNPSAGQSVQHKTWIIEDLKEKPVVFVCHKTGCAACTPQADRIKALIKTYGEDVVFYDLDLPYSGIYTKDTETKFNEVFYYDPNGSPSYIAFTGVFTLIKDGGEVKIGWHSWEGNVDDATMENWIKDAIYNYNISS